MDYVTQQRKWIAEVGLEIGDKVLIVSSTGSWESGWQDDWVEDMDDSVGLTGIVQESDGSEDAGLSVRTEDGRLWNYPFFVLVKVEDE